MPGQEGRWDRATTKRRHKREGGQMNVLRTKLLLLLLLAVVVPLVCAGSASAEGPVKLILSSHIGWEVNAITKGTVCKTECQRGTASGEPGGFEFPMSVAVAPTGSIYIAESGNDRVQELAAGGEFISMFGKEVNESTKGDVCTAEEIAKAAVKCGKGVPGAEAGAFVQPQGVAVEPAGSEEDVYVEDPGSWSIDKYAPDGTFLLRIGKRVNETKDGTPGSTEAEQNVCTAASHDVCGAGIQGDPENPEPSAFDFKQGTGVGDQLAFGSDPEPLLFVGDHNRIQEFDPAGKWKGEIEVPATITAPEPGGISGIAIEQSSHIAYVVYNNQPTIHEFDIITKTELPGSIQVPNAFFVLGISIDSAGHVAVAAKDNESEQLVLYVYKASDGDLISSSTVPITENISGIGFSEQGSLYAVVPNRQEVLSYNLLPVGEFKTGSGVCHVGPERESSDTFACVLSGEVNPYSVPNTQALFEWGKTCALGASTGTQSLGPVEEQIPIEATIENVRPNDTLCFRIAGHDQNVQPPEALVGEAAQVETPPVQPRIIGTSVSFVTSSSAVLSAELNPENAPTEYYFELAAEPNAEAKLASCHNAKLSGCPGVATTARAESNAYGKVGTTLEARGLQANTRYLYRLNADNYQETQLRAVSEESTFTTVGLPVQEAFTGPPSAVTQTSAHIEGAVNPDGVQSTYTFEMGVYEGAATQYDVVSSGSTGAGTVAEQESLTLTGLQPGVTYAYRIAIRSGYGSAQGALAIFTTSALPATLSAPLAPVLLPSPDIGFPKSSVTCKRGYKLSKQGKCTKRKKAKARHRARKGKKKK
jgi:hypothetical protein